MSPLWALLQLLQVTTPTATTTGAGTDTGLLSDPDVRNAFYAVVVVALGLVGTGLKLLNDRLTRKSEALKKVDEVKTEVTEAKTQVDVVAGQAHSDAQLALEAAKAAKAYYEAMGEWDSRMRAAEGRIHELIDKSATWETAAKGWKLQTEKMEARHNQERAGWEAKAADLTDKYEDLLGKYETLMEADRVKSEMLALLRLEHDDLERRYRELQQWADDLWEKIPEPKPSGVADVWLRRPNDKHKKEEKKGKQG